MLKTTLRKIDTWLGTYVISRNRVIKNRLDQAIKEADEKHLLHNGQRYYVLDDFWNPDSFIVVNKDEFKFWQKQGRFSSRATSLELLKEARYYTKTKPLSGSPFVKHELPWEFKLVIAVVILVTVIALMQIK